VLSIKYQIIDSLPPLVGGVPDEKQQLEQERLAQEIMKRIAAEKKLKMTKTVMIIGAILLVLAIAVGVGISVSNSSSNSSAIDPTEAAATQDSTLDPTLPPTLAPIPAPTPPPAPAPTPPPTPAPTVETRRFFTTIKGTHTWSGHMFDITAKTNLHVVGMEIHMGSTTEETIELWTKEGPYSGSETQPSLWEKIGQANVVGQGTNQLLLSLEIYFSLSLSTQGKREPFL